jgi:hypothetical protein
LKNRILKIIAAAWYLPCFGVFLFAIPRPTFRAVTNGNEFRIERRVIGPWYHVILVGQDTEIRTPVEKTPITRHLCKKSKSQLEKMGR